MIVRLDDLIELLKTSIENNDYDRAIKIAHLIADICQGELNKQ